MQTTSAFLGRQSKRKTSYGQKESEQKQRLRRLSRILMTYTARCIELELVVANDTLMYMLSWTKDTPMAAARTLIPICVFRWKFLEGELIHLI
jgi:hypothetical protein